MGRACDTVASSVARVQQAPGGRARGLFSLRPPSGRRNAPPLQRAGACLTLTSRAGAAHVDQAVPDSLRDTGDGLLLEQERDNGS